MVHEHSLPLERAFQALKLIANDTVSRRKSLADEEQEKDPNWIFHGTQSRVDIYSSKKGFEVPQLETNGPSSLADSELPFFRGEGMIEGDWKLDDVLATIASVGARSVWDQRFKASNSALVKILSETDSLMYSTIESPFPVGLRDLVLASSIRPTSSTTAFFVSCSVQDPLVPPRDMPRSYVSLSGWYLRYKTTDEEEDDKEKEEMDDQLFSFSGPSKRPHKNPNWRRHHKTLSRQYEGAGHAFPRRSVVTANVESASPPTSTAPLGTISTHVPRPSIAHRHSQSLVEAFNPNGYLMRNHKQKASNETTAERPASARTLRKKGIKATFVLHANPGGPLPVTLINQLNTRVSLCIATLSKYLKTFGFAPYLVNRKNLTILSELYHPREGEYSIIMKPPTNSNPETEPAEPTEPIRIRFHGLGFSEGRFDVKVLGDVQWELLYDHPEKDAKDAKEPKDKESSEPARPQKPPTSRMSSTTTMTSIKTVEPEDVAHFKGPRGGVTLVITPTPPSTATKLIQVFIGKQKRQNEESLTNIVKLGQALTEANRLAYAAIGDLEDEERLWPEGTFQQGEKEIRRTAAVIEATKAAFANLKTSGTL